MAMGSHGVPELTSFPTDGLRGDAAVTGAVPLVTVFLLRRDHGIVCEHAARKFSLIP